MPSKNFSIEIAKGIGIILVVWAHVIQNSMAPLGGDFCSNRVFIVICSFHMPLFMFISGYLLAYSLEKRSWQEVLIVRCKTVLVPCLCWDALGLITAYGLYLVNGEWLGSKAWFIWFLYALFGLNALLLASLGLKKILGPACIWVVYGLVLVLPFSDFGALYFIKWFYLFFLAGYLLSKNKIPIIATRGWALVFTVCLVIYLALLRYGGWGKDDYIALNHLHILSDDPVRGLMRLAYRYALGGLGILMSLQLAAGLSTTKAGKYLGIIGANTLGIYVIQRYVIEGLYPRLFAKAHLCMDFGSPLFSMLYVPAVTALGVYLCMLISKHGLTKSKILNGLFLGGRGA
jgi:fucose 4-O-acetylase-like acetyltransferase